MRRKDTLFYRNDLMMAMVYYGLAPAAGELPTALCLDFNPCAPVAGLADLGAIDEATRPYGRPPSEVAPLVANDFCGPDKGGVCLPFEVVKHTEWTPVAPELIELTAAPAWQIPENAAKMYANQATASGTKREEEAAIMCSNKIKESQAELLNKKAEVPGIPAAQELAGMQIKKVTADPRGPC